MASSTRGSTAREVQQESHMDHPDVLRLPLRPEARIRISGALDPELHISAGKRSAYRLEGRLFSLEGEAIVANLEETRSLVKQLNESRDLLHDPESAIRASDVNAMGLIDEILHYVIDLYEQDNGLDVWARALESVAADVGVEELDATLSAFMREFPPSVVFKGEMASDEYLARNLDGKTGREVVFEELFMLWLENSNPAYGACRELFDDGELRRSTPYDAVVDALSRFFGELPAFGPDDESLSDMLHRPAVEHPFSLKDQLDFIRARWSHLIGRYFFRLLRGTDLLREEAKTRGAGSGPAPILEFSTEIDERARFSPDRDWMPQAVLLAKNALVWLYQLSRRYERPIERLNEIPDEELDTIAGRGFNALWLIGIWQRSAASRRIKHLCGNPEAEASAYSLAEYEIAHDIGGWGALHELADRCAARGIQLASDMVPNHTGLDSRWVVEHPDWFVQLDHSPFPSYSFTGEDLCIDESVTVQIEDHYYDRTDAAVVFQHIDHPSGKRRFIYHGNDGTHMPWNDTAQLDFLNPDVREAVIQTILHVARSFRIIRFDAAMTLAKQHYQRLWFPEPGSGGDIPSRAEHGLSKEAFDRAMPKEFWREVVDRVAVEAPNTLLLAEAFWMMEGYFVRSLGMHRVYNSAFMNMLKNEENQKYRQTIKNVIEFDREILKRFVNFMNNPDEDTAIQQFGTGDKYFGVCTMMVTMPGLPMFGHGQIEGYTEKYGMEYRRAYLDETPNVELIERHNREIFPLLSSRRLFADVHRFCLYDVVREDGGVTEDIFAYSNGAESALVLVVYNNCLSHRWGWIRESATYAEKIGGAGDSHRVYRRRTLGGEAGLARDHRRFCLFRELRSGLWYIRNSAEILDRGLFLSLAGYQCQVFTDFHEVLDDEFSHYARLFDTLGGAGVSDVEVALKELLLKPLYESFSAVANSGHLFAAGEALLGRAPMAPDQLAAAVEGYRTFVGVASQYVEHSNGEDRAVERFEGLLHSCVILRYRAAETAGPHTADYRRAIAFFSRGLETRPSRMEPLVAYLLFMPLSHLVAAGSRVRRDDAIRTLGLIENWLLDKRLARVFDTLGYHEASAASLRVLMRLLFEYRDWLEPQDAEEVDCARTLLRLLERPEVGDYLQINRFEGTLWFNRERFRDLTWWLFVVVAIESSENAGLDRQRWITVTVGAYNCVRRWQEAEEASGYRLSGLTEALERPSSRGVGKRESEG